MCVIAYKHKDVHFMSDDNIDEMWETNPDGAGIMWRDGGTNEIHFVKGFMKLKHLKKWVNENRKWLEDVECALHFRITTHGGTCPGNCHPFVINSGADSHLLSGSAHCVLMHNGILPLDTRSKDISDSAELALRLAESGRPIDTMNSMKELFKGNRILIMDSLGTFFYGDEFKKSTSADNNGILYSNLNWENRYVYYTPRYLSEYTDDADDLESSDDRMKKICEFYGLTSEDYKDMEIEAKHCKMDVVEYIDMAMADWEDYNYSYGIQDRYVG